MQNNDKLIKILYNSENLFEEFLTLFSKTIDYFIFSFQIELYRNDLLIYLWSLLKKINLNNFKNDKLFKTYINKCIKNYCIYLYKRNKLDKKILYDSELTTLQLEAKLSNDNSDTYNIFFYELIKELNKKQKKIIILSYMYCLSDAYISKLLHISRQAVFKSRKLALSNLHKTLDKRKIM